MSVAAEKHIANVPLTELIPDAKPGFAAGERDSTGTIQVRMNNVDLAGNLDLANVIRVPATDKQISDCSLKAGDVLFNNTNSTELVGKSAIFPGHEEPVTFSNHFTRLRVNSKRLEPRYLARWLTKQQQMRVFEGLCTRWVGQSAVRTEKLLALAIPLPFPEDPTRSLSEQKRIADILDKADAIRRNRWDGLKHLDQLYHAWFMRSVGPDAVGYNTWTISAIEDLAASHPGSMRTGPFGSDLKHSEFVDEGVAVLGIDNAVHNRFEWSERRYITEEKYARLERYRVFPGDVIITIMGTVGRSAVVPDDIPLAINTKHLACITPDRELAEPEFISQAIYRHPSVLRQLGIAGRGAIMTGLNLGIIRSLRIPVPPISTQRRFALGVIAIRKTEVQYLAGEAAADDHFHSLVQRAFKGQL